MFLVKQIEKAIILTGCFDVYKMLYVVDIRQWIGIIVLHGYISDNESNSALFDEFNIFSV